jgi:D,D-heptose 1,7-bisphosphate phosphatase
MGILMKKRAVFLDRDGVINEEVDLLHKIDQLKLINGSAEAIKLLNKDFYVIVATNQPQVARGLCSEEYIQKINEKMKKELEKSGAIIDAIYYCPHHPEKGFPDENPEYKIDCNCRKPKTGMLEQAVKDFDLNIEFCFMIGDRTVDVKTGENAKCGTILVKTGYAGKDKKYETRPDFVVDNLLGAAKLIKALKEIEDSKMKTVILAGGMGERLRPLTDIVPKPMLEIGGKPILEHQIRLLKKYGITDIVICGYYLFDKIKDYFSDGSEFGVNITYSYEKYPLGTGGAINKIKNFINSTFLVLYGDIMLEIDLLKLIMFHKKNNSLLTLVLHESDHPYDSDLIKTDGDRVIGILGKHVKDPPTNLAKTSLFVAEPEIFGFIPDGKSDFDSRALPAIIKTNRVFGYITKEFIKDVGTVERYEAIKKRFT